MIINHDAISQFCAELGANPLLVQGAGGNVSWKEGNILWIKGSGTWLANAKVTNIFVPVDLKKLASSLSRGDFSVIPERLTASKLSPSIETILHALMPQKLVIHLHAIHPLVYLVLQDAKIQITEASKSLPCNAAFIEYFKPGAELAKAVDIAIKTQDELRVLFLKNHGVVIGGDSIAEVRSLLDSMLSACPAILAPELVKFQPRMPNVPIQTKEIYRAFGDIEVQKLAQSPSLFDRLHNDWALYPDHVVFLGPKAFTYDRWEDFSSQLKMGQTLPELIFIRNEGVFISPSFNLAKTVQLRCYYDVISKVSALSALNALKEVDIAELLNWDAEKLRQKISI